MDPSKMAEDRLPSSSTQNEPRAATDTERLRAILNTATRSSAIAALGKQLAGSFAPQFDVSNLLPLPSTDFLSSYLLDLTDVFKGIFAQADIYAAITEPLTRIHKEYATNIASIASSLADVYKPLLADISAVNLAFNSLASSETFKRLRRDLEQDQETVEAYKAAGWPIAPSMTPSLRLAIRELHSEARLRFASAKILGYYHRDRHAKLMATVAEWADHPLFRPRMHIIRDALDAHRDRTYTLSIPALLPQIEGILIEYVTSSGIDVRLRSIKDIYEKVIGDPLDYDMSTWVIASTLLYQLQTTTYSFSEFRTEITKSINTRTVTRHTVLHGIAVKYNTAANSLKAFLLLDALSALQQFAADEPA